VRMVFYRNRPLPAEDRPFAALIYDSHKLISAILTVDDFPQVIEAETTVTIRKPEICRPLDGAGHPSHTFAEFFAGIGLTHMGLAQHGWHCVYANDIEVKKKRMYESCFGKADYYHVEDIWKTKQITSRMPAGKLDLATASFPCVDLSLAGNLKGFAGEQSGAFNGFTKVLGALQRENRLPRTVLIENVIGFLSSHNGKFFRVALKALSSLGYYVDAFIVDAKTFVPQSRPRLFLVGFLHELMPDEGERPRRLAALPEPWALEEVPDIRRRPLQLLRALEETRLATKWFPFHLPPLPRENRTLSEHIDTDETQEWWNETRVRKHLAEMSPAHRARTEELKKRREITIGTIYRRVRDSKSRSEIRTDGLAGCLRTPRGGSSRQIVLVVGKGKIQMRWMTPREYARLQGCPDFPIEVERNEALFGFGDAVCVPVISWIAKNVLTQLFPATDLSSQFHEAAGD
jgi:DNA (cytosine-5)-methyltransferase 1